MDVAAVECLVVDAVVADPGAVGHPVSAGGEKAGDLFAAHVERAGCVPFALGQSGAFAFGQLPAGDVGRGVRSVAVRPRLGVGRQCGPRAVGLEHDLQLFALGLDVVHAFVRQRAVVCLGAQFGLKFS
ncbi:MAG TPA: hypothetical protein VN255_18665 [Mycobacterium sp.]|nr:hypothetical protein [Mycobacterium sp.]HWT50501.1 hypothetical protein [Mycobacterium sp.]